MPGKMARSDPRPSVRVTRGVGSGQHLASVLQEGRENANIGAGLGFIWRISVKLKADRKQSRMSTSAAGDLGTANPSRRGGAKKLAIVAAKLLVTGACFWYLWRQIDVGQVLSAVPLLDFRWVAFATLVMVLEIPLVALRWGNVVAALAARNERMTQTIMIAITAIGQFFSQVLPSVAGDGMRAWLLARLGCDWRNAVTSVVIDRAIGVSLLVAFGFAILLLPSGLAALGGYRDAMLLLYGGLLLAGGLGLLLAPKLASLFARWRYSRWLASLAMSARRVVLGPRGPAVLAIGCLIHLLSIVVVWSLGRAQGLILPLPDAAVLFTVMIGVAVIPISVSGWGLRELAVISVLGNHGVAPEQALLFSVGFGLVLMVGSLPGAPVWLVYSFAPSWRPRGWGTSKIQRIKPMQSGLGRSSVSSGKRPHRAQQG
jgi:glycosyltransferase 2 family protein